jgi:putative SOS response-associated peptidase YedK
VAPTTHVPIVVIADDALVELNGARWGLIPHWWKKEAPPSLTFNARSEEAAKKPTWRHSLRRLRCLMPARGWYEWMNQNTSGQAVQEIIADSQNEFASYPVSNKVNNTRNDFPELIVPLKA